MNLVVMRRAGISANEVMAPEVMALLGTSVAQIDRPYGQLASVSLGEYPISSTQLRRELVQRNDVTSNTEALNACHLWQESLPADVWQYIVAHDLYH